MSRSDPDAPRSGSDAVGCAPERPPSRAAQARLSGALRDRADVYRGDAVVDLTLVDVLLRMDEAEAAVRALDDHRASLKAMARDLQVAVADAAVEREAEAVCDAAVAQLQPPVPAQTTGLRRRVLALAGAAAVIVALVLPTARFSPRTTLTSVEGRSAADDLAAARERLEVARSWARALRADDPVAAAPTALPTREARVAQQVRTILAADTPGESAAPSSTSSTADVADLDAYRASRGGDDPTASRPDDPQPPRKGLLDDVELPADDDVPAPGVPLSVEAPEELSELTSEAGTELP